MKPTRTSLPLERRSAELKSWLSQGERRLGLITSVDGDQLITLALDPESGQAECWESPLDEDQYPSLTPALPLCHWFERAVWDLFGLYPDGHPRLKNLLLHDEYQPAFLPLRSAGQPDRTAPAVTRRYEFLKVQGEGVWEIPVGPIHAGVIEPGHFRLSCLGEIILNLEIRLGFLHRGVESRLTAVPWTKARFVAEAAASDTAVANALAHATAIESLFEAEIPERAQAFRSLALEIERIAMHIIDVGGMATDLGLLGIASSMARMRGNALRLGELLAGSRFQRGFILPGGVVRDPGDSSLAEIRRSVRRLRFAIEPICALLLENPVAQERMDVCRLSNSLARDFGLTGVAARASGIAYDARQHFPCGTYPWFAPPIVTESKGNVMARVMVRIRELFHSLSFVYQLLDDVPTGRIAVTLPDHLPADEVGLAVVESFRGELIHLIFTDNTGQIKRYCIKDPSFNNWTGVSIAVRNNLVADFPICNKSFSLSYGGHDL